MPQGKHAQGASTRPDSLSELGRQTEAAIQAAADALIGAAQQLDEWDSRCDKLCVAGRYSVMCCSSTCVLQHMRLQCLRLCQLPLRSGWINGMPSCSKLCCLPEGLAGSLSTWIATSSSWGTLLARQTSRNCGSVIHLQKHLEPAWSRKLHLY